MSVYVAERATAPTITIGTFNYEHGGRQPDGSLQLAPAARHIADCVPDLDLLLLQEAKTYGRDGAAALYEFANHLRSWLRGSWGAHLAFDPRYGTSDAIFYRHEVFRPVRASADARDLEVGRGLAGSLWLGVDGLPVPLVVKSVHWLYNSGDVRREQAAALGNLIAKASIVGGDLNCLWPGDPSWEQRPTWENLPPHLRFHKTRFDPDTGALDTDLDAGHILARQGWVDLGALAQDGTATTNAGSDRAPCRIDRIHLAPMLAAGYVPGSYTVHIPATPISDHRLVTAKINLTAFDQPFTAPWWNEPSFGGWSWGGGDRTENPNAHTGWIRA